MNKEISPEFPFESKFIEVNGSKMHYVDVGKGDPILFLHGNPTSSYLWRNVIPHLQSQSRCIAPDLIGMGKSDKPKIGYTFEEHYDYLEKFIEKLNLKNVTLVLHDWGSGLGFHYANKHRGNIKGLVFMEAIYKPMSWQEVPKEYRMVFKLMRLPFFGWLFVSVANMFLKKMLPDSIIRKLTSEETLNYRQPFDTIATRKPVRVWPKEVPLGGRPKGVYDIVVAYNKWLQETELPKLCFYAQPGGIIRAAGVKYIRNNFPNVKMIDVGGGIHFLQEDHPHLIGKEIAKWYQGLK